MGIIMENFIEEDRYLRAKKKIEKLKGFYWHFASYFVVNMFISISKIVRNINNGETFMEAFWDFGTFAVWIFWGIGIFFHAIGVFGQNIFFGKDWEERKINEFMDEDKQQ
jgi:hypothetical protein